MTGYCAGSVHGHAAVRPLLADDAVRSLSALSVISASTHFSSAQVASYLACVDIEKSDDGLLVRSHFGG